MSKPNTTIGKSHSCGDKCCKCCKHINPKSFPILTLKIPPQTVLFNDEDFHSVEILETVVRQSGVLSEKPVGVGIDVKA
jgi:hypothetical protein